MSIADKEVFAFHMVNYTDATEGDAYLDMSKVDTSVTLTVGCIQVIFLNKFVSSILVRITHPCRNARPLTVGLVPFSSPVRDNDGRPPHAYFLVRLIRQGFINM